MNYLLNGIIIGIIYGVPAGALGALVIQKTLKNGYLSGLLTGLGSSIANTIYAIFLIYWSQLLNSFLEDYQVIITVIGGLIILGLGLYTYKNPGTNKEETFSHNYLLDFSSGFMIAIMNPGMILLFLFACTLVHISGPYSSIQSIYLIIGTFIGTFIWWLLLCGILNKIKHKVTTTISYTINKYLGILLIIFSIGVIISAFK